MWNYEAHNKGVAHSEKLIADNEAKWLIVGTMSLTMSPLEISGVHISVGDAYSDKMSTVWVNSAHPLAHAVLIISLLDISHGDMTSRSEHS